MKVLLIGPMPYPVTGVSVANEAVVRYVKRKGDTCNIINTHIEKDVTSVQGDKFSLRKSFSFLSVYKNLSAVKEVDVVYTTPGQTFFGIIKYAPFYLKCLFSGIPYIIHLHGNYLGKEYSRLAGLQKWIFRYFISRAAAGIALSETLTENFKGLLKKEKVHVIENFVSADLAEGDYSRKEYDKLRILYMSNLMREKGVLDLLDGLRLLDKQGISFSAEFAGTIESGIRHKVEKRFSKLGERVTYLGLVEKEAKKEAFTRSNVFVLPTWYIMEGQPISIIEAMATANVVVTTRHAGIPDIVGQNEAFFVCKNDPEDLAKVLGEIAENLPAIAEISRHNREFALKRFKEDVFGEKVYILLKTISGIFSKVI